MLQQLTKYALLRLQGPDAAQFLQGQITCDVNELGPQQSRLAAHCNPKGRMISLFQVFKQADDFLLLLPKNLASIASQAFAKYLVFAKAELNIEQDYLIIGLQCENPQDLSAIVNSLPTETDHCEQHPGLILTRTKGPDHRYLLLIKSNHELLPALTQHAACLNDTAWQTQQLQQGIAWLSPATSEKFLPHDINLPNLHGVSFKKGCYTGQEIITRMQHLGKIKNHLHYYQLNSPSLPEAYSIIYNQNKQPIGHVVCAAIIANNHYHLLACVKDLFAQAEDNYLIAQNSITNDTCELRLINNPSWQTFL